MHGKPIGQVKLQTNRYQAEGYIGSNHNDISAWKENHRDVLTNACGNLDNAVMISAKNIPRNKLYDVATGIKVKKAEEQEYFVERILHSDLNTMLFRHYFEETSKQRYTEIIHHFRN